MEYRLTFARHAAYSEAEFRRGRRCLEEWVALKEAARTAMQRPSRPFPVAEAILASPEEFDGSG